jgi:5,6,7,8-tetrahydromethanopterin hydro-lyase
VLNLVKTVLKSMVGETLIGAGPEIAHIYLVIGQRGGPVEAGFMNSLAMPGQGHTPLLAVLEPNVQPKPVTVRSLESAIASPKT